MSHHHLTRKERHQREREANRFYILPGQGRDARRHHRMVRFRAAMVAIVLAATLGGLIWLYHNREWLGM